ncbi:MAG: hypothetical protein KatS3mg095_0233 [Candidatus Parcubacteria bacterium]|nr:MAG: hypothetical protein KatS3mg095_0233 [Candidatus Parcubacteria bacterium]
MKEQRLLFINQAKYHLNKKAQFIPEVFLAIIIFLIVFVGIYNLIYSYVRNLNSSTDILIANFLAQEGLELVRALRNYRFSINNCRKTSSGYGNYPFCPEYSTTSWLGDLGNNNTSEINLCLSYDFTTSSCNNPNFLYLNSTNFFTHQISNNTTTFKRLITISTEDNDVTIENATSVKVTSKVIINNNQEVIIEGIIFQLIK